MKSVTPIYPLKRPRTLTEQAADAIRTRIVTGDFQLGEALSEITLAAELGVSKTPVREAFLQLKNEGLLDIQPQRGTFVFQMTREQTSQLTVLREVLEVKALEIAIETGAKTPGGATAPGEATTLGEALGKVVVAMTEAMARGNLRTYRELDHAFHHRIIAASANDFIELAYSGIAFRVHALRNRLSICPQQNACSLAEHAALAQLIAAGDVAKASAALLEHIRTTAREYMNVVTNAPSDTAATRAIHLARLRTVGTGA